MGPQDPATAPQMDGTEPDAEAGGHVSGIEQSLSKKARSTIGEAVGSTQATNASRCPWRGDDCSNTAFIEDVGDFSISVGVDESVDFLDDLGVGST